MPNQAMQRAITIALEGLPPDSFELMGRAHVRKLVLLYVHEFTRAHGVIYDDAEILDELDEQVRTRRASSEIRPIEFDTSEGSETL